MRRFLKALYRGWMRFAHVLGVINTAILLSLVYLIGIGPMRLVALLGGDDALGRKPQPSYWKARTPRPSAARRSERERMRHQF